MKKATKILCEYFPGCSIYRAGGDEFMILTSGIEEAEIEKRVKKLNEQAESESGVSLAVGMFMAHSGEDIHTAMRLADESMYKNKKEFYEVHPDKKYR